MSNRLLHYTSKKLKAVRDVEQEIGVGLCDKPRGLWLSVEGEDDWKNWCEAESYGDPSKQLCYEVTLADNADILWLITPQSILAFGEFYGCDPYLGPMAGKTEMFGYGINWEDVGKRYDGIIIAPYQWTLRHDRRVSWYYTWDCASGCIWRKRAVAKLTLHSEQQKDLISIPDSILGEQP